MLVSGSVVFDCFSPSYSWCFFFFGGGGQIGSQKELKICFLWLWDFLTFWHVVSVRVRWASSSSKFEWKLPISDLDLNLSCRLLRCVMSNCKNHESKNICAAMATYGNTTWGIVRHNFQLPQWMNRIFKQMFHDFSLNFSLNRIATIHPIPTPPLRYHVGDCWPRINPLCDSWCDWLIDWLIDWSAFTSENIELVSTPPPPPNKERYREDIISTGSHFTPGDQIVYLPTGLKSGLLWVWCFWCLHLLR